MVANLVENKKPLLIMPCGPSGSGKSTLFKKLKEQNPALSHYSWDNLRLEWYDPNDYSHAWELACKDKQFESKARSEFGRLLELGVDIYIDNINNNPRSRATYLYVARSYGYHTVAYVFNLTLDTLLERRKTRGDKTIPEAAVRKQFGQYKGPVLGEFDEIRFPT